jgi:cytochrome c-type biogenesis protein CcmH/NrfG
VAIDKSHTKPWVKAVLIFLIVAFVLSFVALSSSPWQAFKAPEQTTQAPTVDTIDAQYQPAVASITAMLQSDPESYTALVSLGNTYFDWAVKKQQASQNSTATMGADLPLWTGAKDAYARAVKVKGDESTVRVDYAITLFYTGDTVKAIAVAEDVMKDDPTFSPAWFNAGIFFQTTGATDKAIAAFEQYLKLDPKGSAGGSPDFAKQQLETLKKSSTTTSTP